MTDIVPNLLRLSSELQDVAQLFESALDLVLQATGSEVVAITRSTLPDWSVEAIRGAAKSAVPLELAAETLERNEVVAKDRWIAAPLTGAQQGTGNSTEAEYVLLIRGNCPESRIANIAHRLSDALSIVDEKMKSRARIDRLQAILIITNQWHQSNDMETLLVRMAEAATRLLHADRASIF